MKRTYILLVATLFVATAFAQPQKQPAPKREGWDNHYEKDALQPLYGDVKMVTVTKHKLIDKLGELVKGSFQYTMSYEFNQQGNVISYMYPSSGIKDTIYDLFWVYNSNGKVMDFSIYKRNTYYETSELQKKHIYKYDPSGNLIELATYDEDMRLAKKTILRYDAEGNAIEESRFYSSGAAYSRRFFKYDTNGNRIEELDINGNPQHKCKYDSWGNRVEIESYDGIGRIEKRYEYEYNANGDVIRLSLYNGYNNELQGEASYSYVYDSAGNRIEKSKYYYHGPLEDKYVWKYDAMGNVIEETYFIGDIMAPQYIIEYDIVYREQNELVTTIE